MTPSMQTSSSGCPPTCDHGDMPRGLPVELRAGRLLVATPVMGDPRQAKMMLFMPIVFTFMFLNLPAGLVLYWTLSNVLQIAQQKYMEHRGKAEKVPARAPKKA